MGEVYRARDEKLNRDVAIKVPPSTLSADKDRLARFEQEAKAGGGQEPHWSPDGRDLYYRNNGSLMVVPIETRTGFQAGTPKNLFGEIYDLRSNTGETYDLDPRGGRFLLIRPPKEEVSSAQVRMVLNWSSELQRLVPVK